MARIPTIEDLYNIARKYEAMSAAGLGLISEEELEALSKEIASDGLILEAAYDTIVTSASLPQRRTPDLTQL